MLKHVLEESLHIASIFPQQLWRQRCDDDTNLGDSPGSGVNSSPAALALTSAALHSVLTGTQGMSPLPKQAGARARSGSFADSNALSKDDWMSLTQRQQAAEDAACGQKSGKQSDCAFVRLFPLDCCKEGTGVDEILAFHRRELNDLVDCWQDGKPRKSLVCLWNNLALGLSLMHL